MGSAFEVQRILENGFLEKVYQKAMQVELLCRKFLVKTEKPIKVIFNGYVVGDYYTDLLVEGKVIVELKAAPKYSPFVEAQLITELRATGISVGMLTNFAMNKVEFKCFSYSQQSAFHPRESAARKEPAQLGTLG